MNFPRGSGGEPSAPPVTPFPCLSPSPGSLDRGSPLSPRPLSRIRARSIVGGRTGSAGRMGIRVRPTPKGPPGLGTGSWRRALAKAVREGVRKSGPRSPSSRLGGNPRATVEMLAVRRRASGRRALMLRKRCGLASYGCCEPGSGSQHETLVIPSPPPCQIRSVEPFCSFESCAASELAGSMRGMRWRRAR